MGLTIKFKTIFLLYFKYYLLLDLLMGFLLKHQGLKLVVNPGQIIRGGLLFILIIIFFGDIQKKIDNIGRYYLSIICFALTFLLIYLIRVESFELILHEINYLSKILFLLLSICYVLKHHEFFSQNLDSIIFCNFVIFSSSIIICYFFKIGLSTYSYVDNTSKGFFYGGNPVSVLSLVFFIHYLFDIRFKLQNVLLFLIALFNIHAISTKAVFVMPLILLIYLFNRFKEEKYTKRIIGVVILVPFFVVSFLILKPIAVDLYENRYGKVVQRAYRSYQKNERVFESPLTAPLEMVAQRRVMAAKKQMTFLLENPGFLLFGIGHSGQVAFWAQQEAPYHDASMDVVDVLFQYGIVGTLIIFLFIFKPVFHSIIDMDTDRNSIILLLLFAYSCFGGHVITASTSGTMLALFAGIKAKKYDDYKLFKKRFQWLKS